jgi:universal stress protein A
MPLITNILVPVDFSPCSRAAMRYALALVRTFRARLEVLHVWELPGYLRPDLTVWAGDVSGSLAEHARREAEQGMRLFVDESGLLPDDKVHSTVLGGTPYASVLAALEDGDFDLVVMGTHGRTGLSHVLLGSVAERVVRHAKVPVLTVRAPEGES